MPYPIHFSCLSLAHICSKHFFFWSFWLVLLILLPRFIHWVEGKVARGMKSKYSGDGGIYFINWVSPFTSSSSRVLSNDIMHSYYEDELNSVHQVLGNESVFCISVILSVRMFAHVCIYVIYMYVCMFTHTYNVNCASFQVYLILFLIVFSSKKLQYPLIPWKLYTLLNKLSSDFI